MAVTLLDHQINLESFVRDCHFFNGLLNKEQLTALEKHVDEVFFSTFFHSIEHINLSDEQKGQLLNSIGAEQLELIRKSHEESILMQMMAEAIK